MGDWDPARYLRFSKERGRPCRDLLARLAELTPSSVLDVGCGPGNSTAQLAAAFPAARVCGIDASEEMLKKARAACPGVPFVRAAVPDCTIKKRFLSPIIGAHLGKGAIVISFWKK